MKHADIVKYIKSQRIRWTGHIVRLSKERMVKRVTEWRPMAARTICRPRLSWEDDVIDIHSFNTCHKSHLHPPSIWVTKYQKGVHYMGVRIFNKLPP
jgi:hypothetical protein